MTLEHAEPLLLSLFLLTTEINIATPINKTRYAYNLISYKLSIVYGINVNSAFKINQIII